MRCKLSEIALVSAGQGAPQGDSNYCESGTPFVKAGNLQELSNGASIDAIQKVSNEVAATHGLKLQRKGSVLFAKSGMSCLKGYVYVLPEDAYIVSHLACVTPMGVDSDYLCYYFRFHRPNKLVKDAAYPSISLADIGCLEIEIPEGNEVTQIVDALKRVESIINLHCQQITALDTLIKARFVEMFGEPETNPMQWKVAPLKQLMTVEPQNGLYKPQSDYVQDGSGTPILRIDAFYDGRVTDFSLLKRLICSDTEKQRYLLCENDIVINRVNSIEYLGKCAHITGMAEDTVFESNMMRFHLDEKVINAEFATHLLCSKYIYNQILRRAKKAVNQASINQGDVQSFVMLVPPLELQNQFAAFVAQIDKSKVVVQKALDEAQVLFDSLMQQYFG